MRSRINEGLPGPVGVQEARVGLKARVQDRAPHRLRGVTPAPVARAGASARIALVADGFDLPRIVPHLGLGGLLLEGLPNDSVRLPI
jgi:hypothetical protein